MQHQSSHKVHGYQLPPTCQKLHQGIGLVEVMWKEVAEILNRWLKASITFHNFLHGFRAGLGTGTATLEDKLLQQLSALREEVLYVIFLDLHKEYGALNRSRCLEILEGYGVGPRGFCILRKYWSWLRMAAREGGRVLRGNVHGFLGSDAGRPVTPQHFQRIGGCGSASLGVSDGGGHRRAGQAWTRG